MKSHYLFLILCAVVLTGCEPNKSSVPADMATGNEIAGALGKYKGEHGHYPEQLSDLVPKYISEIKPPRYGEKKWIYVKYRDKGTFALFMWGAKAYQDGYMYDPDKNEWEVVENSF